EPREQGSEPHLSHRRGARKHQRDPGGFNVKYRTAIESILKELPRTSPTVRKFRSYYNLPMPTVSDTLSDIPSHTVSDRGLDVPILIPNTIPKRGGLSPPPAPPLARGVAADHRRRPPAKPNPRHRRAPGPHAAAPRRPR